MIKNSFHLSELYMHAVILFWPGGFDVNFSSKNLKQKQELNKHDGLRLQKKF